MIKLLTPPSTLTGLESISIHWIPCSTGKLGMFHVISFITLHKPTVTHLLHSNTFLHLWACTTLTVLQLVIHVSSWKLLHN